MSYVNDVGGRHGFGGLAAEPAGLPAFGSVWEGQLVMLTFALVEAGHLRLEQHRHALERLAPQQYLALPYYQRWLAAMEELATRQGWW